MWYCKSKDLIAGLQYSSFATSRWYQVLQYSLKDKNMQPRFIKCFSITMVFIQATDPSTESKITRIKFSIHFSNTKNGHIYYLTKTHIWSLAFFLKGFYNSHLHNKIATSFVTFPWQGTWSSRYLKSNFVLLRTLCIQHFIMRVFYKLYLLVFKHLNGGELLGTLRW